jgi:hypothetical protein
MSCNESKIVLRSEIPRLKDKTYNEAFLYFKEILGEPNEIDEYDGEVEYFQYEGKLQPIFDYDSKRWGIDLVLHHESDYKTYIKMKSNGLTLDDFNSLANQISLQFSIDKYKIKLMSYTWYNGVDEPINFE